MATVERAAASGGAGERLPTRRQELWCIASAITMLARFEEVWPGLLAAVGGPVERRAGAGAGEGE